MMIAKKYISQGIKTNFVLNTISISKSSYYYEPKDSKRGQKASITTHKQDGSSESNQEVVKRIETLLEGDFVDYGYQKVTHYLKRQTYIINKKKVYRLMKENQLLHNKQIRTQSQRQFVKYRKVDPKHPYELLEMDIKYIYVPDERRNVFLLSIIDVFSRKIIKHLLKHSIRQDDVIRFLQGILVVLPVNKPDLVIRTDNGSQFAAKRVRQYLYESDIEHEFTHISTPEENAHIEAFHSILERELLGKTEFNSFIELELLLLKYNNFYNKERIHSSIGYMPPEEYLEQVLKKYLISEKNIQIQNRLLA